jgi:RNA-directed DNA polymerase
MYYIQKFGIDEHREYRELTKGTFRAPAGKNKFCFTDQSKDTEFIRYKSFLIDLKRKIFEI